MAFTHCLLGVRFGVSVPVPHLPCLHLSVSVSAGYPTGGHYRLTNPPSPPAAVVYGFNVEAPADISAQARSANTSIRLVNVIYRLVDDVREELDRLMPLKEVEEVIGQWGERRGGGGGSTG